MDEKIVKDSQGLAKDLVNDCISRQAAIEALIGITTFKTKHELMQRVNASVQDEQGWLGAVAECLDEIEDLPSAQLERKKGEWIPVTNGRGGFECDQCHNYAPSYQDGVEWLSGFCPNCGADMRGEQDE